MLNVWSGILGSSSVADGIASNTGVAIPRSSAMLGGSPVADVISNNYDILEDISVTKVKKEHTDVHCVIFKAVARPRENLSALVFPTRSIKYRVVQPQKTSTIFRKERNGTI